MSKIYKGLRALRKIALKPSLLNHVLDPDEEWANYVNKRYPRYSGGLPVVNFEELFDDLDVAIDPFAFLDGGSLPTDLALLNKFAQSIEDCKYFEIGTWRGESVANVARFARKCVTLNLSKKEMKELGFPGKYINLHFQFSKGIENIRHLEGNSASFDFGSLKEKFDLVFIDGDHHYHMVRNDTEKVFANLVHDDSIIVWHDYALNPEKVRFEVLAGILDGLPKERHPGLYHFGNSLSAFLISKPLKGSFKDAPYDPEHAFRVKIDPRRLTDS
jgi:predicted O-methyltransferase YrrM